ncbi:hypothetical protein K3N28_17200 [Glycomyces sp. TRM65418]|uniref:hypothetical protein n=1 Tax=Glycomyces sp. TRM65418 TaxID=2867006 RepID=UPI001CE605C3|nr:hypothetical protein [Glycomyces sp. TRM65418]MCC3764797.1 hypothetical protein [Glycomyces sp. TRM65418]QZD54449.1 hypothetical protein K3N28_17115 [Glycomyces sp. TRM65418]
MTPGGPGLELLPGSEGFDLAAVATDAVGFLAAVATRRPDATVVDVRPPPAFAFAPTAVRTVIAPSVTARLVDAAGLGPGRGGELRPGPFASPGDEAVVWLLYAGSEPKWPATVFAKR